MSMYLVDIQICSKSEDKHVQYLKRVLHVQRENQFHAKMAMCYFWKEKLHYLGHVVGIEVDPQKIETITKWHRAKTSIYHWRAKISNNCALHVNMVLLLKLLRP